MEILNTGWTLPCNIVNATCVIESVVLIGLIIALIGIGIIDEFSITIISWLIMIVCILSVLIAILMWNKEKTYYIYLDDMTLKELETEYEPYEIDGLILECTKIKKGDKK